MFIKDIMYSSIKIDFDMYRVAMRESTTQGYSSKSFSSKCEI